MLLHSDSNLAKYNEYFDTCSLAHSCIIIVCFDLQYVIFLYLCLFQCSNGNLHTLQCAANTVFNPEIGVCDHPENVVGCEKYAKEEETSVVTESQTTTNPPVPRM